MTQGGGWGEPGQISWVVAADTGFAIQSVPIISEMNVCGPPESHFEVRTGPWSCVVTNSSYWLLKLSTVSY